MDAQYLVQTTPGSRTDHDHQLRKRASLRPDRLGLLTGTLSFSRLLREGISSFVSSGDSGASGCDPAFATPPFTPLANSPNYICSSSFATCVGGHRVQRREQPHNLLGYKPRGTIHQPQSYIPEGGWNEPLNSKSSPQVAASGGGVSRVIPTPAWQTGTGVPAARSGRYTPDVSFSASCHDGYFGCMAAEGPVDVSTTAVITSWRSAEPQPLRPAWPV